MKNTTCSKQAVGTNTKFKVGKALLFFEQTKQQHQQNK